MLARYGRAYDGVVIGASGFTPEAAEAAVAGGLVDAVAFGRLFLSTPDLPERLRQGQRPNKFDRKTFYTLGTAGLGDAAETRAALARGYTDYRTFEAAREDDLLDLSPDPPASRL